jgi:hypothetical protein
MNRKIFLALALAFSLAAALCCSPVSAGAAGVTDRIKDAEERERVEWLIANPEGVQGFYWLDRTGGVMSMLEIRELPQTKEGVYEFDVRLTVEADIGGETVRRVFHNAGSFTNRRIQVFDTGGDKKELPPLYVEYWLGDPFKQAMEVIADDAFRNQPNFKEWYRFFAIEGVYYRKTLED